MDSDPTPGDPAEVRELSEELQTFADDVGEALGRVRGMADDRAVMDWAGLSADAFRSEFDGVPGNLEMLQTSYALAAQALGTYWPKLETAQGMADRALDRAIAAQADLSSAQGALSDAQDWVSRAGDEADRLEREGEREDVEPPSEAEVRAATRDASAAGQAASSAQGQVDSAEEALSAARELARQAREMREEAARICASDIDEASDAGIQNRSWWENLVRWLSDAWDTLVAICKIVVAVLGVIAMIIGGPLALIVLAAAVVVLADTLVKYANGEGTLLDVAFAALDCIPGMRGLTTLGGLARGVRSLATTGLRGLWQGVRGLGQSIRRMGRIGDGLVCRTDPIDMATGEMVMDATDVELPGVLPLVVRRHHRSSLREGTWFGPSWASTLDQRLVLDETGLRFVTADGMILDYPRPVADEPVLPVEGPRWGLSWDGTAGTPLTVHQRESGLTLHFAPVPGRRGGELPLTAITDDNGNRVDLRYDATGAPTGLIHQGGYHLGVTTAGGRVTALRLLNAPDGPIVVVRYGYDEHGNLAEVFNSSALPLTLSYDEERRITGWEDRNGTWYRYTYDDQGRCVATDGTDGYLASRIAYDTDTHRTLFTDALGNTTVYQFNDSYQLVTETDPLGHHTHRTHDRYDRLRSVTDPLGRTTTYTYDDDGARLLVTRPDGSRLHVEYDEAERPIAVTEADGARWRQVFDAAGNRVASIDPDGARTGYGYDERGALTEIVDALGQVTRIRVNGAGLAVAVVDPLGAVTECARDAWGRIVTVTDPLGAVTRHAYSPEGWPLRRVDPLGRARSWSWDGEGNCLTHTDENGGTTHLEYGPFDVVSAQTDPAGVRHEFRRDAELRLTEVTDPWGHAWTYHYDPAGRLVSERDFDGRVVAYAVDAAGALVSRTNAVGQAVHYTRDALGTVTEKHVDGQVTVYVNDAAGRLVGGVGPDGSTTTLTRDAAGRITAENVDGRVLTNGYDALGRLTERATPAGHTSTWTYDALGRPLVLATPGGVLGFEHDAAGRETRRRLGDSPALSRVWDPAGALVGQVLTRGGGTVREQTVLEQSYRYRADGYLAALGDRAAGSTEFTLDPVGRITGVTAPGHAESYAYDPLGNQLDARWPTTGQQPEGTTGRRAYAGHRVARAGGTRYTYDEAGRVVVRQRSRSSGKPETWRYTWDAEDRLTGVTTPDGARWRYLYDAFGRRSAKRRLGADDGVAEETRFTWSGTTLVEQTSTPGAGDRPGTTTLTWDYLEHEPLTQTERADQGAYDRRFHAIVTDLVGTPILLVDRNGDAVRSGATSVWGAPVATADGPGPAVTGTPLGFPGQYRDQETGWHYSLFRHYDPEIARYTAPDPLGLTPAPNPYGYVRNPTAWMDALGLGPCRLFHYTNLAGLNGILRSRTIFPSLKALNPKDARYGDGQYLTDIAPQTRTLGQLSYAFLRMPWAGRRFTHYLEIDVRGLNVVQAPGRPDVFVIPNQGNLDVGERIINHGRSTADT
ncbi:HYD1 signature containing ADP-ribosyltransferase family protein [Streptomyces hainanensis]|uniref:Uncharacterized protein n=1 Tax=Streptomyces hainanensis TaxID=402648 RepID=A0A4R4TUF3_9ACTN|nr:HYD1 signature containing ADP-ribosyltransferase family protein [Streptomyces hainanensis]TDC77739.1 hypothetical protein E1283_06555 [Streptomyces hainanensis]